MTAASPAAAVADPLDRVAGLLRARQVSCRGGLDDLAQAVLGAAQTPPRPSPAPPPPAAADELVWRRERAALLGDRDMLVCALTDLVDAVVSHHGRPSRATAAALDVAAGDALEALAYPGDPQTGALDAAA